MSAENCPELIAHLRATALSMRSDYGAGFAEGAVARFVDSCAAVPAGAGYRHLPPAAHQAYAAAVPDPRSEAGRNFLFAALLEAMAASLASPRLRQLPARVLAHQLKHYERMLTQPAQTWAACEPGDDLFLKDFGLAAMRMLGGGSNLIDVNSGIERSLLWKGGLRGLPRRLALFARTGGARPFFEIHAHKFYMEEFNEQGRNECYRCCAELYALYPRVRGMTAGSWFYDPAVAAISPHLAYLREVPERGGAVALFNVFDEGSKRNALARSATRRRLFEEGRYRPATYTLVWPRARHLAWAGRDAA